MTRSRRPRQNRTGFTLIELVIATGLMVLVANITMVALLGLKRVARTHLIQAGETDELRKLFSTFRQDVRGAERVQQRVGGYSSGSKMLVLGWPDRRSVVYYGDQSTLVRVTVTPDRVVPRKYRLPVSDVSFAYDALDAEDSRFVSLALRMDATRSPRTAVCGSALRGRRRTW